MWSQKAQTQTAHRGECSSFGATEQEESQDLLPSTCLALVRDESGSGCRDLQANLP